MLAVISYRQGERFITAIYQAVATHIGARGQAAQTHVGDKRGNVPLFDDGAAVV
ncbi:hypothetical protein ACEU6F_14845 [Aeromonas salmonicida]|uniref:hypothetical protein n=1 Tax=Aeromonas salmonicida TaxID=645 RepID=UPI0035A635B4